MAASRSDAGSLGERIVLLDGAGTFGPLLDNDKKIYNLDHHWGCERLFTLSTCEQALLLVLKDRDAPADAFLALLDHPDVRTHRFPAPWAFERASYLKLLQS